MCATTALRFSLASANDLQQCSCRESGGIIGETWNIVIIKRDW